MNNYSKIGINNNIYILKSTVKHKNSKKYIYIIILHYDNKKWQFTR